MEQNIVKLSEQHVKSIFDKTEAPSLFYHNWSHTTQVLAAAEELATNTPEISERDKEMLLLACLFHDVAYTMGSENHEHDSAELAEEFLLKHNYSKEGVATIKQLILATKMGYKPTNLLEQIMQDADLAHLANPTYLDTSYKDLYKEIKANHLYGLTESEWKQSCETFFKEHNYHTAYAKTNYTPKKKENLVRIEELASRVFHDIENEKQLEPPKKKKKKKGGKSTNANNPEKGVQTMFRVALRNHMSLSQIADNKANTLISVNGIIISIVLSALFPKMDKHPYLILPGINLVLFSIITIVLAILSTIPRKTMGRVSKDQVNNKEGNLIFFGNFHNLSLDQYKWSMNELIKDQDYLYNSLTTDLYFLGKVLNRKYSLLRWSYYTFVTGLVLTIIMFGLNADSIAY